MAGKNSSAAPERPWLSKACPPCACAGMRRATRAITAFYDDGLAPAGVTVTQYSILVNLSRAPEAGITELAERLGMDRTTMSRSLQPLLRDGLAVPCDGEDQRQRPLRLTPKGERLVARCYKLWSEAQSRFRERMGEAGAEALQAAIAATIRALR